VGLDDLSGDREAESAAACGAVARRVDAEEAVEDAFAQLRGDAGAVVLDGQAPREAGERGRDPDAAAVRAELDRVLENVAEGVAEPGRVAAAGSASPSRPAGSNGPRTHAKPRPPSVHGTRSPDRSPDGCDGLPACGQVG